MWCLGSWKGLGVGVGDLGDLSHSSLPPWASISPAVNRSFLPGLVGCPECQRETAPQKEAGRTCSK